ncbi:MAG: hypothetical protein OEZ25_08625 [Candidatus Bathyarchaeota archaeon]|nr:hypothetical protein [Candidatus Bathyarchaeota archaeon]
MSKPKRKDRKAEVKGISSEYAIKRYKVVLEGELDADDVPDKGEYVLLHKRIKLPQRNQVDIIVYSSEIIYVSGSAYVDEHTFGPLATRIIELAQQAVSSLEDVRPISVQRAKSIYGFACKLDPDDEYQRMVMIVLADTCNEIILREQMKAMNIEGAPLDEGIPDKIKRIKAKGGVVAHESKIKNRREERNRVVHYGDVPHKGQASEALKVAEAVINSVGTK